MRLDISFLSPDRHRYRAPQRQQKPPALTICPDGQFLFNVGAHEMLGLRPNLHMMLGQSANDPREWYLRLHPEEGFLLLRGQRYGHDYFKVKSVALRKAILDTLPFAPSKKAIRFSLDAMTLEGPDNEPIWPLVTAPYWFERDHDEPQKPRIAEATNEPPVYGLYRVLKAARL